MTMLFIILSLLFYTGISAQLGTLVTENEGFGDVSGNLIGVVLDEEAQRSLIENGGDLSAILSEAGLLNVQPILDDPTFIERRPYPIGGSKHIQRNSNQRSSGGFPGAVQFQAVPSAPAPITGLNGNVIEARIVSQEELSESGRNGIPLPANGPQMDLQNLQLLPFDQAPESIRREIERMQAGQGISSNSNSNRAPAPPVSDTSSGWSSNNRAQSNNHQTQRAPAPPMNENTNNGWTGNGHQSQRAPAPPNNNNNAWKSNGQQNQRGPIQQHAQDSGPSVQDMPWSGGPSAAGKPKQEDPKVSDIPWSGPPISDTPEMQRQPPAYSQQTNRAPAPPVKPASGSGSSGCGRGQQGGCGDQPEEEGPVYDIPWSGPPISDTPKMQRQPPAYSQQTNRAPAPPVKPASGSGSSGCGGRQQGGCGDQPEEEGPVYDIPWSGPPISDFPWIKKQQPTNQAPAPSTKPSSGPGSNGCGGSQGACGRTQDGTAPPIKRSRNQGFQNQQQSSSQSQGRPIPVYNIGNQGPPVQIDTVYEAPPKRSPAIRNAKVYSNSQTKQGQQNNQNRKLQTILMIPEDSLRNANVDPSGAGIQSFPLILAELVPVDGEDNAQGSNGGGSYSGSPGGNDFIQLDGGKVLLLPLSHLQSSGGQKQQQSQGGYQQQSQPTNQGSSRYSQPRTPSNPSPSQGYSQGNGQSNPQAYSSGNIQQSAPYKPSRREQVNNHNRPTNGNRATKLRAQRTAPENTKRTPTQYLKVDQLSVVQRSVLLEELLRRETSGPSRIDQRHLALPGPSLPGALSHRNVPQMPGWISKKI